MKLKISLAAAAGVAATLMISSAAEAISIGSRYTLSGQGFFTPTSIDFIQKNGNNSGSSATALVTSASGDFAGIDPIETDEDLFVTLGTKVIDLNIPLVAPFKLVDFNPGNTAATNLGFTISDDFDFIATSASYDATTKRYLFRGYFGDNTPGRGEIAQLTRVAGPNSAFAFSGAFVAVPTPALLPGLIGMGIATLRRQRAHSADAD